MLEGLYITLTDQPTNFLEDSSAQNWEQNKTGAVACSKSQYVVRVVVKNSDDSSKGYNDFVQAETVPAVSALLNLISSELIKRKSTKRTTNVCLLYPNKN